MANVDFPSGFKVLRNENKTAPVVTVMDCVTTVLYEGALAFVSTTGLVQMCGSSIVSAALAKKIVGVFANAKAAGAVGAEGSISKIRVYTDPDQLYSLQTDDNTADTTTEIIGHNFAVVAPNAGDSSTLRSITEIDGNVGSSVGCASSTNAEIFLVLGVEKIIGNSLGANLSWTRLVGKLNRGAHLQRSLGGQ